MNTLADATLNFDIKIDTVNLESALKNIGDLMKSVFKDAAAEVDKSSKSFSLLNEGLKAVRFIYESLTLKIPLYTIAQQSATKAADVFKLAWKNNPFAIIATGIEIAVAAFGFFSNAMNKTDADTQKLIDETEKYVQSLNELNEKIDENRAKFQSRADELTQNATIADDLTEKIFLMSEAERDSIEGKGKLLNYVSQLNALYPDLNLQYSEETGLLNMTDAEIQKQVASRQLLAGQALATEIQVNNSKELMDIEQKLAEEEAKRAVLTAELAKETELWVDEWGNSSEIVSEAGKEIKAGLLGVTEGIEDLKNQQTELTAENVKAAKSFETSAIAEHNKKVSSLTEQLDSAKKAYTDVAQAQSISADTTENLTTEYNNLIANNADLLAQYPDLYASLDKNNTAQENGKAIAEAVWKIKKQLLIDELKAQAETIQANIDNLEEQKNAAVKSYSIIAKAASLAWLFGKEERLAEYEDIDAALADANAQAENVAAQIKNLESMELPNIEIRTTVSGGGGGGTGSASSAASSIKDSFALEKEAISDYADTANATIEGQIAMWQDLTKEHEVGSKERIEIDKNIRTLIAQRDKESFNNSKAWIDEEKYYNRLSLEDELAAWQRVQDRYAEGSEQRKEADREAYRVRGEIVKEAYDKEKEYLKSFQTKLKDDYDKRKEFGKSEIEFQNETSKEKIEIISNEYLERIQWEKDEDSIISDDVNKQMSQEFDRSRERLQNLREEKAELIDNLALTNDKLYAELQGLQAQRDAISKRQQDERDAEKAQGFIDKRDAIYDKMATATAEEQLKLEEDLRSLEKDEAAWNQELADRKEINRISNEEKRIRSEISENSRLAKEAAAEYNEEVKKTVDLLAQAVEIGKAGEIVLPISLEWFDEDLDRLSKLGFGADIEQEGEKELGETIVEPIQTVIKAKAVTLQESGKTINENIGIGITDNVALMEEPATEIIDTTIQTMKDNFSEFSPFVIDLYNELRSLFDEQPWTDLGYNMIMGMVTGVYSAMQSLIDAVLADIRAALDAGRSELEIASPAKATISDGINWVLGYISGIKKTEPQLISTIKGVSADMLSMPLPALSQGRYMTQPQLTGAGMTSNSSVVNKYYVYPQKMTYVNQNEFIGELSRAIVKRGV